jgi:hypothetical protein
MRMDKKAESNAVKQERALLRKKKTAVFLLTFCFYLGLAAVDSACSEMTGHPGSLILKTVRIDKDQIAVSFLGKETLVNTDRFFNTFYRFKNSHAKMLTDMHEELPFPLRTL